MLGLLPKLGDNSGYRYFICNAAKHQELEKPGKGTAVPATSLDAATAECIGASISMWNLQLDLFSRVLCSVESVTALQASGPGFSPAQHADGRRGLSRKAAYASPENEREMHYSGTSG